MASFTLSNTGGSSITISKSKPPSLGLFVAQTSLAEGSTIAAGGQVTETVKFTPSQTGSAADSWVITADDGNGAHTVALTATSNEVDSIMGESSVLPLDDYGNANLLVSQQASLGQKATIESLSFYVTAASGKLRLGIYDATGPGGGPGAKMAETSEMTPVVGWNTAGVTSPTPLAAGTYWLAYFPNDDNLHFAFTTGSGLYRYSSLAYGSMPSTFSTTPSGGTGHWSFYATLAPPSSSSSPDAGPDATASDAGSEAAAEAGFDATASADARSEAAPDTGSGVDAGSPIVIGESTVLRQNDNSNSNLLVAQQASLGQIATIESLSFYVSAPAGRLRLGVYDATGPGGGPGAKMAETNEITPAVGWNTAPVISPVSLPAGAYWLTYFPSDDNLNFEITTSTGSYRYYSLAYGAMPPTFSTTPNGGTGHWSFYATLSP